MTDLPRDILRLQRPPIRKTVVVRTDVALAFDVFTRRMAQWWPLTPFSRGGDRVTAVEIDPFVGGAVTEVWDDGTRHDWGQVLAWDPPTTFALTWNITRPPTEVELSFTALARSLTRVQLEHRGWERLSEAELGEDCALPGGYLGGSFNAGWDRIMAAFVEHLDGVPGPGTNPIRDVGSGDGV